MTGAKGSTVLSTSTISRVTRVLTYRFNGGLTSREAVPCVKLSRWSLYLAESVTLIMPPPWEDIFPFRGTNAKINATCRLGGDANEILALLHVAVPHSFSVSRSGSFITSCLSRTRWNSTSIFPRLRSGTAGVVWVIRFGERLSHDVGAPIVAYQLHTVYDD